MPPSEQAGLDAGEQRQRDRLQHAGQPADLLGEDDLRASRSLPEEPPDSQADQHLLAARSGIEQPPLAAAMHPPGHRTAHRARGRLAAGPGLHPDRPACREDLPSQREQGKPDQGGQPSGLDAAFSLLALSAVSRMRRTISS